MDRENENILNKIKYLQSLLPYKYKKTKYLKIN